jgi:hypothetical protein
MHLRTRVAVAGHHVSNAKGHRLKVLVVDEFVAAAVRRNFDLYLQGSAVVLAGLDSRPRGGFA